MFERRKRPDSQRGSQMPEEERTRFVADAMLGSLARKLRVLGFDTAYYRSGDDAGLIEQATEAERVILTGDRALASLAARRGAKVVLLSGKNDGARLRELKADAKSMGFNLHKGAPLCSVCNGPLSRLGRPAVADKVPSSVALRHKLFYQCSSCGKVYWKGGHWKKLRSFERLLVET